MSEPLPAKIVSRSVRLNWRGVVFLVLTFAVGFAAAVKGNNLLFIVFSSLVGLFVAAIAFTLLSPAKLEIGRVLPEAAHAYEVFPVTLRIRNRKRFLPAFALKIEDRLTVDGRAATVQPGPVYVPLALPGEKLRASSSAASYARGWAKLGPLTITSEFPPGLITYRLKVALDDQVLIYPRRGMIQRRILNPYLSRVEFLDLVPTAFTTGEDEFAGIREYRPGDNLRRVHWKMSARVPGRMVVKEFEALRVREAVILLETFVPAGNDRHRRPRLERAVSFAGALAEALLNENYLVKFRAFAPDPVEIALEPRQGALADLQVALALLKPTHLKGVEELLPDVDPLGDEVYFILTIGDEPPDLLIAADRRIIIPAAEMRSLMYYAD